MTDANAGGGQLDTAFPPPPEYYKQFTAENLAKLAEHRTVHPDTDRDNVPGELSFLVPPTIPPEDDYYIFGRRWLVQDILPTLPEQNVEQLYPEANFNRVKELKKLNTSLIFKYLELIERLSQKPEKCETDIDDIRLILINMHHLINEYRPYQARETLKLVMADQVERRDRSVQEITK
ncbi:Mediator of RNA polymerase II transcription subunit 7 [Tieghemiomyces parasiticus]|uniref:Mediator of RNA polymerase II transcription subunit 7 n=1 Tax=Tieghemiomyces parasiticus TaxID=78921 RepID=A0A9W8A7D4_9FUNG|nr:Mediator of RNA polymerase II transcription subunit 7 [Tieghemiomyces parasiticus]